MPREAICETPLHGVTYSRTDMPDDPPKPLTKPALVAKQEDEYEWVTEFLVEEDGAIFSIHYGDAERIKVRRKELKSQDTSPEQSSTP